MIVELIKFEHTKESEKRAIERLKILSEQKGWTREMSRQEALLSGLCVRCEMEAEAYSRTHMCQSCKDDMAS